MYLLLELLELVLLFLAVIIDFFLSFRTSVLDTFRAVFSTVVLAMAWRVGKVGNEGLRSVHSLAVVDCQWDCLGGIESLKGLTFLDDLLGFPFRLSMKVSTLDVWKGCGLIGKPTSRRVWIPLLFCADCGFGEPPNTWQKTQLVHTIAIIVFNLSKKVYPGIDELRKKQR